jgi:hypothetical protein
VWFARVAPPAALSEYKVVVRHRSHAPAWLLDEGNCLARRNGNNVLHTCDEPSECTPALPSVELPGDEVDLCTRCEVSVSVPFTALDGLEQAEGVVLQGEQLPLSWGGSFAMSKGASAFTATFRVPRGRHEYQLKVDDGEFTRDPAACGATPNGKNSFLYGCYEPPACE